MDLLHTRMFSGVSFEGCGSGVIGGGMFDVPDCVEWRWRWGGVGGEEDGLAEVAGGDDWEGCWWDFVALVLIGELVLVRCVVVSWRVVVSKRRVNRGQ